MTMAKDWLSSFQSLFVLEESWPLCTDASVKHALLKRHLLSRGALPCPPFSLQAVGPGALRCWTLGRLKLLEGVQRAHGCHRVDSGASSTFGCQALVQLHSSCAVLEYWTTGRWSWMLSVHLHGLSLPQQDPDIREPLPNSSSVLHPTLAIGVDGRRGLDIKMAVSLGLGK